MLDAGCWMLDADQLLIVQIRPTAMNFDSPCVPVQC